MIVKPTYIFFIGILSLSSFLTWGFILAGGGVQDGLGIYLIVVPAIFGKLLIMLIDRILVSKYGTKRVNKFERII
jgi:pilus assembly protein TadC